MMAQVVAVSAPAPAHVHPHTHMHPHSQAHHAAAAQHQHPYAAALAAAAEAEAAQQYAASSKERKRSLPMATQQQQAQAQQQLQQQQQQQQQLKNSVAKARPTNNQLLYKAYFRWHHYSFQLENGTGNFPTETDACASVTAAFLQVLHSLHVAEVNRIGPRRNILQILSTNTRRTKVVELSTGTHRVPEELKKHYLSDGEDGQYSTNLDRNRYGNDDQYLFTVVRYDLEFLHLCPCLVDVEIIDAKNDNQSIVVTAGSESCTCQRGDHGLQSDDKHYAMNMRPLEATSSKGSPGKSISGGSQLFDALVMAATGGANAMEAQDTSNDPPINSRCGESNGARGKALGGKVMDSRRAPVRQKSRMWSALSYGEMDSLQNALDAFRAEEEIASGPNLSDTLGEDGNNKRRAVKGLGRDKPSTQSLLGFSNCSLGSLLKGGASLVGLQEKSGDNLNGEVVSSGAALGNAGAGESTDGDIDGEHMNTTPSDFGKDDNATERRDEYAIPARRVRHVPRQSSAANLGPRVAPAEVKRLSAELETSRIEIRHLQTELQMLVHASENEQQMRKEQVADRNLIRKLEEELYALQGECQQLLTAKQNAEETIMRLTTDLSTTRQTANMIVSKLLYEKNGRGMQPGYMPLGMNPILPPGLPGLSDKFHMAQGMAATNGPLSNMTASMDEREAKRQAIGENMSMTGNAIMAMNDGVHNDVQHHIKSER